MPLVSVVGVHHHGVCPTVPAGVWLECEAQIAGQHESV